MSRLVVFNAVSIDGYFTDKNGDMSWAFKNGNVVLTYEPEA